MEKTMNISFIYGSIAVLSLLLACGYCALVRKKEIWLIWLYFSAFIANLGYFALSISKTVEEALLANRLSYLGCVFLPLFMLMTIMKVCHLKCPKVLSGVLICISFAVFLLAASQGYAGYFYEDVSLVFANGTAKLEKVYGPLHIIYYVYLFAYLGMMIGTICVSMIRKKIVSYKHAGLLTVVVFLNMAIWFVEQLINWDFEFLSVSYIVSELLLLFLYGMIQDYDIFVQQTDAFQGVFSERELSVEQIIADCPEIDRLSSREKDVLMKILEDKKRKEIADELYITENTVKKHISSIFSKMDVTNRNELFEKIRQK